MPMPDLGQKDPGHRPAYHKCSVGQSICMADSFLAFNTLNECVHFESYLHDNYTHRSMLDAHTYVQVPLRCRCIHTDGWVCGMRVHRHMY